MTRKMSNTSLRLAVLFALTFGFASVCACAQTDIVSAPESVSKAAPATTAAAPAKPAEAKDESDEYRHSAAVTKLGSMVGMNSEQASTAFTISNLVILLIGVGYLVMKNLPKSFRSRSATIKKQLVDARTATEEAQARLNSVEDRLSKLDDQIAGMRAQADADGEKEEQRMKAAIEDEKAKILASAGLEIQSATSAARREIQKYAAELAIEQAARKLVVNAETDRLLVEGFAERLVGAGKGEN
jgi:F-type H+-transporting ATPase subunit b